ncbi:ArsR/SmtB family transcription factor [Streptomyces cyanogenus]|nr:ArsR family transcriptional regulator [Streptomyces cyanogenus]
MPADRLARVLGTLANPHRLGVVAALARRRNYVSRLARELGISRALLQAHLRRLEAAGLVTGQLEISSDGKAMKFYEVTPFALHLTPQSIADALSPLTIHAHVPEDGEKGSPQ